MRTLTLLQPPRLLVGRGSTEHAIAYLAGLQPKHLRILTSASLAPKASAIADALRAESIAVSVDSGITSEPTISVFERSLASAREQRATCVLGIGGGSALDVAKLVAAFVSSKQPLEDAIGIGRLGKRTCHLVCMPSTAGTGSEVSPNAVLLDEVAHAKRAVISEYLVPDASFVDPELSRTVPAALTASTGLDALAHSLEAYTSKFAHPVVDVYALEGITLCGRYLRRVVEDPNDMDAREGMALASLYGGFCLGPVNTAGAHALAYPLGSECGIPHGLSVAMLLPHIFEFNSIASPGRHAQVVRSLCDISSVTERDGARVITELATACGLKLNPADHGVPRELIPTLAASAMQVTRLLNNNPRPVTLRDCVQIYEACFAT